MSWAKRKIEEAFGWESPKRPGKPVRFKNYKQVYKRFWHGKESVRHSDVELMVKLIDERVTKNGESKIER